MANVIESARLSKKATYIVFEGYEVKFGVRANPKTGFLAIHDAATAEETLKEIQANLTAFTFGDEIVRPLGDTDKIAGKSYEVVLKS